MSQIHSAVMLRNRLKVRQLNLLAVLGESPSLHKAAERLGMSQPAATRLLRELEEMFCCPLFERTNRGLIATETGRLMVKHASLFVDGIDKIYEDARSLKVGSAGSLRVGMSTSAWPDLAPRGLIALKREHPRIAVQVQDGIQSELLAALKRGALDVVVGRAPTMDQQIQLHFEPLYDERFVVVAGLANPLEGCEAEDALTRLVDRPWILPPPDVALRRTLENQFVGACGRTPADFIDSASLVSNLAILAHGEHVALMAQAVAAYFARLGQLKILTPPLPNLSGTVGAILLQDAPAPSLMDHFIAVLRQQCPP